MAIDWVLYAKAAAKWIATIANKKKKQGYGCGCGCLVVLIIGCLAIYVMLIALLYDGLEGYYYPLENHRYISSHYGPRDSFEAGGYITGNFHNGTDFPAPEGTPIYAVKGGTVTSAGDSRGSAGIMVIIAHDDGNSTRYFHCSSISVEVGDEVGTLQEIGKVGNTGGSDGNHLHIELRNSDYESMDIEPVLEEWPEDISTLSISYFVPDKTRLLNKQRRSIIMLDT